MNYIVIVQQNDKLRVENVEAEDKADAYELINDFEKLDEMDYFTAMVVTREEAIEFMLDMRKVLKINK